MLELRKPYAEGPYLVVQMNGIEIILPHISYAENLGINGILTVTT